MTHERGVLLMLVTGMILLGISCQNGRVEEPAGPEAGAAGGAGGITVCTDAKAFAKDGFITTVVDGRLWVLKPGQEISEKCVTLVGEGRGLVCGLQTASVEFDLVRHGPSTAACAAGAATSGSNPRVSAAELIAAVSRVDRFMVCPQMSAPSCG